jgi:hypothetical protein
MTAPSKIRPELRQKPMSDGRMPKFQCRFDSNTIFIAFPARMPGT